MKQEDEEFEKLLGEIPHVTNSASQGSSSDSLRAHTSEDLRSTNCISSYKASLPGSEIFEQFFPAFQGIGSEREGHLSSHSYSGVMASMIQGEDCSSRGNDAKRHLPTVIEEEEEPLASLGFAESHPHELPDDASLIAALERASLEPEPAPRPLCQADNTTASTLNSGDDLSAEGIKTSGGLKHRLDFTQGMPMPTDLRTAVMPLMVANNMKLFPKGPASLNSCANGYSVSVPYRPEAHTNCSPSNSRITHANGGLMYAYTPGIGTAHIRTSKNNLDYNISHVNLPFFGDGTGAQQGAVAFHRHNGVNGHAFENHGSVYYGGRCLDQPAGLNVGIHNPQMVDRLPMPPNNLHVGQPYYKQSEAHSHWTYHTQDTHQDASTMPHYQATAACKMHLNLQRKEEGSRQQMQLLSGPPSQALACAQHHHVSSLHSHACGVPSFYTAAEQPCPPIHIGQFTDIRDWKSQTCERDLGRYNLQGFVSEKEGNVGCALQGFGAKADICPPGLSKARSVVKGRPFRVGAASPCSGMTSIVPSEKSTFSPVRILSRGSPHTTSAIVALPCVDKSLRTGSLMCSPADAFTNSTHLMIEKHRNMGALLDISKIDGPKGPPSLQGKFGSLEEVEGHIYSVAKDQHGCRFLQRQFDEGGPKEVEKIFVEIVDHILELMTDPFGNYLVQKLLEVCNEAQRMKILKMMTTNGELINVSLNMHGTRAVQKLIETLTTSEQVFMVTSSLRPGVVTLIKDLNGNHVVQRCLQHLSSEDSQFIFEVVTSHCVEIATHRHGCCVLQRCIDFSKGTPQQALITEIATNALLLSQDPFGNYVVQYILDLGMPWVTVKVVEQLVGHFAHLSMQKFSSNVVEKCLKFADEDEKTKLVQELMEDSHLLELLQDPYANYVIQCALMVSKGNLHASLVDAICPHTPFLRSSPYGKRILSRRNLKKC